MESDKQTNIVDARTDEQWLRLVNNTIDREDWEELWSLAHKTPPIWTLRIVKLLRKKNWSPPDDGQESFFEKLCGFAKSCNEFDVPGPDIPVATSWQLNPGSAGFGDYSRIRTARITADGEFLFVLDDKATALEIYSVADTICLNRIRLDMIAGRQHAVLGVALDSAGRNLAVLTFAPRTKEARIRLCSFEEGELLSDRWIKCNANNLGRQIPRLCFDGDGRTLAMLSAPNMVTIWEVATGKELRQFENVWTSVRDDMDFEFPLQPGDSIGDWCKFGRRALADISSHSLAMTDDGKMLLASRGNKIVVWNEATTALTQIHSSSRLIALDRLGGFTVTIDMSSIHFHLLHIANHQKEIALCRDRLARIALSHDSELVAAAMPHFNCVKVWHLPDGRNLGTLLGLAHDQLVDFRITTGGSIIAVARSGLVQTWEADGNGNAWPWAEELVRITHQPVDKSSVQILRQAQEMRRRGWLSAQESNLLDLALSLMENRLNLDIEIEWDQDLPGDKHDIEIED